MGLTTAEILAYRVLKRDRPEDYVDWAVQMLGDGSDSTHLRILAGMTSPFSLFEIQAIFAKALRELQIAMADLDSAIESYAALIMRRMLAQEIEMERGLAILSDVWLQSGCKESYLDFGLLQHEWDEFVLGNRDQREIDAARNDFWKDVTDEIQEWLTEREKRNPVSQ